MSLNENRECYVCEINGSDIWLLLIYGWLLANYFASRAQF